MVIQFPRRDPEERNLRKAPHWYRQAVAEYGSYRNEVIAFPTSATTLPDTDTAPDPGDLRREPAPSRASEAIAELAELYAMALLRDVPFERLASGTGQNPLGVSVGAAVQGLNALPWFDPRALPVSADPRLAGRPGLLDAAEQRRRLGRVHDLQDGPPRLLRPLRCADLYRGSAPGAKRGPQVSQFLLQGPGGEPPAAFRDLPGHGGRFPAQRISPLRPDLDYLL